MGKDSGKSIKLGLFITTALVVIMVAVYLIGQKQHLFSSNFRISGTFNDVGGLQAGNNVRFAGVNIGTVESIAITGNNTVKVVLLIDEEAHKFIKKDSIAAVGSESMMGNKVVVLAPGSEDEVQVGNNGVIRTAATVTIDDILKQIKHTSDNAVAITANLAELTGTIHSGKGTLGKVFMDQSLANDMRSTVGNFKESSAGLKELMTAARKSWLFWGAGKSDAEKKKEEVEKENKEREKKEIKPMNEVKVQP